MRTWRVGTISMGITLIFLGVFLVLSQILHWKPAFAMMAWWPVILIVLGIEILVFLFLSKKENPIVKYDLFSILFVGVVGFVGIGLMGLSATGILDKVHEWTNYEVKTLNLPAYTKDLDDDIERVVIDSGGSDPLSVETGTTNEVAVFGTYTTEVINGNAPIELIEDYLLTEEKGDTLYIKIKSPAQKISPFGDTHDRNMTLIIPSHIKVELQANNQYVNINSRTLQNDWTIENAISLDLRLNNDMDVLVHAENIDEIKNENDHWKLKENSTDADVQSGTYKLGKGSHVMNVINTSELLVTTN